MTVGRPERRGGERTAGEAGRDGRSDGAPNEPKGRRTARRGSLSLSQWRVIRQKLFHNRIDLTISALVSASGR